MFDIYFLRLNFFVGRKKLPGVFVTEGGGKYVSTFFLKIKQVARYCANNGKTAR